MELIIKSVALYDTR